MTRVVHLPRAPGTEPDYAAKFHAVLEAIAEPYYEVDLRGNLVLCNSAFCRMLGYSASELDGIHHQALQGTRAAEQTQHFFNQVYLTGQNAAELDWSLRRKDGSQVTGKGSIQLVRNKRGRAVGFCGILREVCPQQGIETALRVSEQKFRTIIETSTDAYFEVDLKGYLVMCNGAFCRMLGYEAVELIGHNYRAYQTPAVAEATFQTFNHVFRTGAAVKAFDWMLRRKDGSAVVGEGSVQLVRDAAGAPAGFSGFLRDVTERRRVEQALRASEEKYRGILETIEDPYYEVDLRGNVVMCNDALCRMLGYNAKELIGKSSRIFQTPEVSATIFSIFNEVYRTGQPAQCFDWPMVRKNRSVGMGEGSVQLVRDLDGAVVGFRGIIRDVTQRRSMEDALKESEARFRALTNLSSDWYWEMDQLLRFTRMDSRHGGGTKRQHALVGHTAWDAGMDVEADDGWQTYKALAQTHEPFRDVVMRGVKPNGEPFYLSVSGEPVFGADDSFTGYRGVAREITEKKNAEERIQHLATHDVLTGLPNRGMFSQLLNEAIAASRRNGGNLAVLFVDLDRFKVINDTFGHEAGDTLLVELAERLRHSIPGPDVIARLGGDEFVVLVEDVSSTEKAAAVARRILSEVIGPVSLMGREYRVTASIGIALYPQHGDDERALMKYADIAMYHAKEEGKNNFQFYSPALRAQTLERLVLENNLRFALERRELSLDYQPKRHLQTGAVTGVEALLRWHNAELGSVSPLQFIPVAEETGLIIDIGKWVLQAACAQNMAWQRRGLPPMVMAVNLSVRQLSDVHLIEDIAAILRATGMPPELLELEITESMVISNPDHALNLLKRFKEMGLRLAVDDFGTGYSSLGLLKNYPIDTLKIDRSFIRDIPANTGDKAITKAIIAMGKTLGLSIIAEGVETSDQETFLREHGCDEMQGYYFSKPAPAPIIEALLGPAGKVKRPSRS